MPGHSVRARAPRGEPSVLSIARDPDVIASFLEDAAHFPGGHAAGIAVPSSEAQVAALLRTGSRILPIGAQSSLTGGATPMGEVVLSTARLNAVLNIAPDWVRVQPGVTLVDLDAALTRAGKYFPPAPTFAGAFVGGIIATNAAGAATFKYGTTRDWVRALTVVLPNGDVLDLVRGAVTADTDGTVEIVMRDRTAHIQVPSYRMPEVAKLSAGYFAAPGMDLIDLFIGSEGTLGVIVEATLRVLPSRPAICLALVPCANRRDALRLVTRLRDAARDAWRSGDPHGLDVSAIEHMDARCLALLREDGADRLFGVAVPTSAEMALLITLELPTMTPAQTFEEIGQAREPHAPDTPLVRFCRMLDEAGILDEVEIAVPGDRARAEQLLAFREAVPAAVNARVGRVKQSVDARIAKTAADMIVPFEHLEELLDLYDSEFGRRHLDLAVWGHISDGNLHPNVIPRSMSDVELGNAAILACGRDVIRLGGSPLAEHGVGRNPVKQRLLLELYGREGMDAMRAVKRALDPDFRLSPGVLFTEV
jgi:D-lactate dehydrogenase (cytochrome)